MPARAPRLLSRKCRRFARGAGLIAALWAGGAQADIERATYEAPTGRYAHGVLGDAIEYGALRITDTAGSEVLITLPDTLVFEDVAPRVVDVTGDGAPEVIVVESHQSQGARLAIYTQDGRLAATPFIGTRFRWLAPTGLAAADFDGDGAIELAYVDRPHLAKTLRIWRWSEDTLTEVAQLAGVTNHRIGEPDIAGGIRDCGAGLEIIVADAQWREVLAVTLSHDTLMTKPLGAHRGRESFATAMACDPL